MDIHLIIRTETAMDYLSISIPFWDGLVDPFSFYFLFHPGIDNSLPGRVIQAHHLPLGTYQLIYHSPHIFFSVLKKKTLNQVVRNKKM